MKGIVVDKNQNISVLLLSDGTFKNINRTDLEIGSEVYLKDTSGISFHQVKRFVPIIAAAFIMAFLGTGVYTWLTPVQYINIDINPSVELSINRFDRIIKTTPLNDDGGKLLQTAALKTEKYDSGINTLIHTAKDLGYLHEDGDVLISISSSDAKLQVKAQSEIEQTVAEKLEILTFDTEAHDQAAKMNLSPGRTDIINRVIESGTNLSQEELKDVPVKELMQKVKENKKLTKEMEKENKNANKSKNSETTVAIQKTENEKSLREGKAQASPNNGKREPTDPQNTESYKGVRGEKNNTNHKNDKASLDLATVGEEDMKGGKSSEMKQEAASSSEKKEKKKEQDAEKVPSGVTKAEEPVKVIQGMKPAPEPNYKNKNEKSSANLKQDDDKTMGLNKGGKAENAVKQSNELNDVDGDANLTDKKSRNENANQKEANEHMNSQKNGDQTDRSNKDNRTEKEKKDSHNKKEDKRSK